MMLLGFMGLAVPLTTAVVTTSGQLSLNSKVYNNKMDRLQCNRGAIEHAIWRIKHEPGFVDSLTEGTPLNYDLDQCGDTPVVTITERSASVTGVGLGAAVDYTVPAGNKIEFKFLVEDPSEDDMWASYDTVDEPSWVKLPSPEHGDRTYRLHNNPTPPVGDTMSQYPLSTDQVMPTATTLYNYDTERDSFAGLLIQKNNTGCGDTDPVKFQNWQTAALATDYHIEGIVTFNMFSAMKDFVTDKIGIYRVCVRDKNGGIYTDIIDYLVTLNPGNFDPGVFVSLGNAIGTYDIEVVGDGTMRARITLTDGNVEISSIQIQ